VQSAARSVSFLEPLDERPSRVRHPKRPSTVHRPISESRSRPFNKRRRCFEDPKTPSATRRPASKPQLEPVSDPQATDQSSEEHVTKAIDPHRSPAKPSAERQRHVKAPKSSSAACRPDIKPRVEPSDEHQSHVQAPKNPSMTRRPAFQPRGTFSRASARLPGSEEPFHKASTRLQAPQNLPTSFRAASRLRRTL
jgi:hypothetical protein